MNGLRRCVAAVRKRLTRRWLRIAFLSLLITSGIPITYAAITDFTTATKEGVPEALPTENHTVVTESARYGTIIAYAPNGSVTYYNNTHTKYFDVERLETGDESTGGYSAAVLGLKSRTHTASDGGQGYDFGAYRPFISLVPSRVINAIIYVTPTWMGISELGPAIIAILVGMTWSILEVIWSLQSRKIGVRLPVYKRDD